MCDVGVVLGWEEVADDVREGAAAINLFGFAVVVGVDTDDEGSAQKLVLVFLNDAVTLKAVQDHACTAAVTMVVGLVMIKKFEGRIIYPPHITDLFTAIQDLRIAGTEHFVAVNQAKKDEQTTGRYLVGMKSTVMHTYTAKNLLGHGYPSL